MFTANNLLIIDDNRELLIALKMLLKPYFHTIHTATEPPIVHQLMEEQSFDLILLDMNFNPGKHSGKEGLYWLEQIMQRDAQASVVCMTAYGAIELAVKAMQAGAVDFIEKPWDEEKLIASILRAQNFNRTRRQLQTLQKSQARLTSGNAENQGFIPGNSPRMQQLWQSIEKIAPTDANVLITGENGTGKELIARALHKRSQHPEKAFVAVDMGAITPTLFESELFGHVKGAFTDAHSDKPGWFQTASGGTLFLDEIANIPANLQAKLLSVLQRREVIPVGSHQAIPVDIRLITATNANLAEKVASGSFREDLYYRLNTLHLQLPPLRERTDEIAELASYFQKQFTRKYAKPFVPLTENIVKRLIAYPWPGNIRELKHTLERAIILSEDGHIRKEHLHLTPISNSLPGNNTQSYALATHEKLLIQKAIRDARGNYSQAAKMLGISRRTLYNKIGKYGIQ